LVSQVRWKETADQIGEDTELLVGDVFLGSASISYYGAFTGVYRDELVQDWIGMCQDYAIPVSAETTLRATLANPVEIREWNIWGLPTDGVSIDNGILTTRGKRWPLMIDPQGQGNTWVKAMCAKSGLRIVKLTDPSFLRTLENSVRIGSPVLMEDVGEMLDPSLETILNKQVFMSGGRKLIRIGDSDVDYDENFKFYMTTKLPNPHYLPEVCIKVTIINFTVTRKGLEDQLLGDVVRSERPDLEELKDRLVVSIANDKKQLKDLEDKILKLLKESKGNILDDEVLINTLNNSKITSGMIQGRVKEAEVTEKEINEAREKYRTVASQGSIIYFVIADLALVGPMYQFSLTYFAKLFNKCLEDCEKSPKLPKRLRLLNDFTMDFMFTAVCRGLFEEHKLMYAFLLCTSYLRDAGEIGGAEWNFLLRGISGVMPDDGVKNLFPGHLPERKWKEIQFLAKEVPAFRQIMDSLAGRTDEWIAWMELEDPEAHPMPEVCPMFPNPRSMFPACSPNATQCSLHHAE
jgi:dynein heavy chain